MRNFCEIILNLSGGSGDVILRSVLSTALPAKFSEAQPLCNFGIGHYVHFCEIILNLYQWFRCCFLKGNQPKPLYIFNIVVD